MYLTTVSTAVLESESEPCLALPVEFCWIEKEGIPSWRNGKHKVVGRKRTNGSGVQCKSASADLRQEREAVRQIVERIEFQVQGLKIYFGNNSKPWSMSVPFKF